jgi:hypothetical protein
MHVPHITTPPQRVSVTNPQLAFSASHVDGGQPFDEPPPTFTANTPPLPLPLPPLPLLPLLPLVLPAPPAPAPSEGGWLATDANFRHPEAATKAPNTTSRTELSHDFMLTLKTVHRPPRRPDEQR